MLKKTFFIALFTFIFSLHFASAQPKGGAVDISGDLYGAPYRVVVPENWNGTLLVYAHGYRDRADHPGEVDNRNADVAPSAALEPVLLAQGYALAGTAYRNNGWAVEEGIQDMRNLVFFFRNHVAQPQRTIIWAFSMGTVIGFRSIELYGGTFYDGALCACAVGAGTSRSWDSSGDLLLAYDTVFGKPATWGTIADVRDDLDFETEVFPKVLTEVNNPANFPAYEFIRLVVGTPGRGINPPPPPAFYPGWVFTDMFFATEARAELERRAQGPIVQNLNRNYNLTPAETGYLIALGVPPAVIQNWLAAMNARRNISAPHFSRYYVEQNADYTGRIGNPVLTIHTLIDPLVTVSQERAYAETVAATGHESRLFQTYTDGNGHCNFTGPQLITAVNAINSWVITGVRPTQANFPAAIGFLQNFTPPPLNQP
ncbi:MAG: hypothetical protein M3Q33_12595 [Acidobacteriota bacterium]|nr:hypothetical protein [Acidobacteriota bacterium]